ncbi:MAG: 2-C-methyl-D-erythritol 4-phosphate cytidylyltransferase [Lachnospiraceae bacterium]|nr:2-C-methyl-D-erythritol 4-phosphate cytidylyltransferase [Lachnospiraceae bacterium]
MNIALLLSGGTGTRLGGSIPKQYREAGGKPVIFYCMQTFARHRQIDAVQIVADAKWQEEIDRCAGLLEDHRLWNEKFRGYSSPGKNRQLSIWHGLKDIKAYAKDTDYVLIHDAARPLLSLEQIAGCLKAAAGRGGAMPVLPMKDTVYFSKTGRRVDSLLDRRTIYAGQAPEVFLLGPYYEANRQLLPEAILKINGSTEPAVMAGMDIAMIPGDEGNFKITTRADLERFCRMAEKEENQRGEKKGERQKERERKERSDEGMGFTQCG